MSSNCLWAGCCIVVRIIPACIIGGRGTLCTSGWVGLATPPPPAGLVAKLEGSGRGWDWSEGCSSFICLIDWRILLFSGCTPVALLPPPLVALVLAMPVLVCNAGASVPPSLLIPSTVCPSALPGTSGLLLLSGRKTVCLFVEDPPTK